MNVTSYLLLIQSPHNLDLLKLPGFIKLIRLFHKLIVNS